MNGGFQVNPNDLQQAANDFNRNVQTLEDTLRTITNTVEMLRGSWKGNASESFDQAMIEWKTSVHNLNQALEVISQNVNKSGISYSEVENAVNNAFKGMSGFK
jgi:WXG100 family type VII secretion target